MLFKVKYSIDLRIRLQKELILIEASLFGNNLNEPLFTLMKYITLTDPRQFCSF